MTSDHESSTSIIPPEQILRASDIEIQALLQTAAQADEIQTGLVGWLRVDAQGIPTEGSCLPSPANSTMAGDVENNRYATAFTIAEIDHVGIDKKYQHKGIGTRLYKAFARLAIVHGGATHLSGETSAAALRRRDKIFGVASTEFYTVHTDFDPEDPAGDNSASYEKLDPEVARRWIEDGNSLYKNKLVITDMRHADISGWKADLEVVAPAYHV